MIFEEQVKLTSFNEAEEQLTLSEEKITTEETITYTRKKTVVLAAELLHEDVLHNLDEADKVCGHSLTYQR